MNNETTKTALVIELAGKQFVVGPNSRIVVNRLGSNEGDTVNAKDLLTGQTVSLKVIKNFSGEKIRGLKFKNKVRYTRRYGHRQLLTELEVVSEAAKPAADEKPAKTVSKKKPVAKKATPKAATTKNATKSTRKTKTGQAK